jgi:hypothetical protein
MDVAFHDSETQVARQQAHDGRLEAGADDHLAAHAVRLRHCGGHQLWQRGNTIDLYAPPSIENKPTAPAALHIPQRARDSQLPAAARKQEFLPQLPLSKSKPAAPDALHIPHWPSFQGSFSFLLVVLYRRSRRRRLKRLPVGIPTPPPTPPHRRRLRPCLPRN